MKKYRFKGTIHKDALTSSKYKSGDLVPGSVGGAAGNDGPSNCHRKDVR